MMIAVAFVGQNYVLSVFGSKMLHDTEMLLNKCINLSDFNSKLTSDSP